MKECLFCKIVNGEVPVHKIFENEYCLAFLDIHPIVDGHVLVIPKKHYENIFDIPKKDLNELSDVIKLISKKLKSNFGASGVNILNASGADAQQTIFHLHFHIIPRFKGDKIDFWFKEQQEIVIDLEEVAKKIRGE